MRIDSLSGGVKSLGADEPIASAARCAVLLRFTSLRPPGINSHLFSYRNDDSTNLLVRRLGVVFPITPSRYNCTRRVVGSNKMVKLVVKEITTFAFETLRVISGVSETLVVPSRRVCEVGRDRQLIIIIFIGHS